MENIVTEGKRKCQICGRIFRTKRFIFNRVYKDLVCYHCDKKKGNNKWFVPKEERKELFKKRRKYNGRHYGRYSITQQEKLALHQQLIATGLTSQQAWERINNDVSLLKEFKIKRILEEKKKIEMEKIKKKQDIDQMKKIIEGLRNAG